MRHTIVIFGLLCVFFIGSSFAQETTCYSLFNDVFEAKTSYTHVTDSPFTITEISVGEDAYGLFEATIDLVITSSQLPKTCTVPLYVYNGQATKFPELKVPGLQQSWLPLVVPNEDKLKFDTNLEATIEDAIDGTDKHFGGSTERNVEPRSVLGQIDFRHEEYQDSENPMVQAKYNGWYLYFFPTEPLSYIDDNGIYGSAEYEPNNEHWPDNLRPWDVWSRASKRLLDLQLPAGDQGPGCCI